MEAFSPTSARSVRAEQLRQWIHQHGVDDSERVVTNLSKNLRTQDRLNRAPAIAADQLAADGTRKWQLRVDGSNAIETVFIEIDRGAYACRREPAVRSTAVLRHRTSGFNHGLSAG